MILFTKGRIKEPTYCADEQNGVRLCFLQTLKTGSRVEAHIYIFSSEIERPTVELFLLCLFIRTN